MKQLELSEAQASVESNIAKNIEQLMQEKMLIAAGNRELMKMTETIHEKLGMMVLPPMRLYSNVFEYSVFSLTFNLIEVYANLSMVSEMLVLMVWLVNVNVFILTRLFLRLEEFQNLKSSELKVYV